MILAVGVGDDLPTLTFRVVVAMPPDVGDAVGVMATDLSSARGGGAQDILTTANDDGGKGQLFAQSLYTLAIGSLARLALRAGDIVNSPHSFQRQKKFCSCGLQGEGVFMQLLL